MKINVEVQFVMKVTGNTGYCNKSELQLVTEKLGHIILPKSKWDLEPLRGLVFTNFFQYIPSGMLSLDCSSSIWTEDSLIIEGKGEWNGKLAGLEGGMSGYGDFNVINYGMVTEGVYLETRNYLNMMDCISKIPVSFQTYLNRKNSHQKEASHIEEAAYIASLSGPEDLILLLEWNEKIKEWDKLGCLG